MEDRRQLDPDSEIDLFCLHLVFIPIIRQHLEKFQNSWNVHGIRTAPESSSPVRLFVRGITNLRRLSVERGHVFTELIQVVNFPSVSSLNSVNVFSYLAGSKL